MKFPCKVLCVALLAFLTVPVTAQGLVALPSGGSSSITQASGSMTVSESVLGWTVQFSGMGAFRPVVLAVGASSGRTRVDLSPYGSLTLDVSNVGVMLAAGTTSASGDLTMFVPRPSRLPARVDGSSVFLQGFAVDVSTLQVNHQAVVVKTNVAKIFLVAASSYQ
jgi:hypothetical protein